MNTPWAASDVHLAPVSDVDDGYNDIVTLRGQFGGRCRMASLLTALEDGSYFNEQGEVNRDLPIDYIKAKSWELRPNIKAPQPEV